MRQQIATMTAIKNIIPNMQKASASFDVDKHSVPSDGGWRTLDDEYSSTENWKMESLIGKDSE